MFTTHLLLQNLGTRWGWSTLSHLTCCYSYEFFCYASTVIECVGLAYIKSQISYKSDILFLLVQMNITGNVVRLTRCENVPGFTTLFAAALAEAGCPYYPEYRVYEEYAAFGQTRFVCQVHVIQDDYAGGK